MSFIMGILVALIVYGNYQVKDLQKQLKVATDKIDALDAAVMSVKGDLADTAIIAEEIRKATATS
ncbi:hypothetical protein JVX91_03100 [Pseudomonas sp. PDNC002]|uniref:hypothetical protein n=1 Tax=Pseudomonas sp. PDNC002 TaxID=2811422 RepID=UPI00196479D9|nr:hypothetical protein [Pseudomonas sp. PDNC002]QRY80124.1 hypothetical protein JVX91_03100 [Pseudomonas sp. PDNC002]